MTDASHNTVIAAHGRHFMVQQGDALLHCVTRGKKSNIATGDHVRIHPTSPGQGVIEAVLPRNNLLFRSDQFKSRLLAANVDQLFIVIATEPYFSDDLVSRALVGAEAAGIAVHLILNKTDVSERLAITRERVAPYAALGYPVHEVSATTAPEASLTTLLPLINGKITLLIGQSGMGKSSLINLCVPDAEITTREISTALNSGKHTTTFTRMYFRDAHTALIDSPGFQEFGLYHLSEEALVQAFREFIPYLGKCRFHNCHHLVEPGCAILEAIETGSIAPERQQLYAQLHHESSQKRY